MRLGFSRGHSRDISRGGKPSSPRLTQRATPQRKLEHCESPRLHLAFSGSVLRVETHAMSDTTGKITTRWKDHRRHGWTTTSNQFEVLRLRVSHQSRSDSDEVAGGFKNNTFLRRTTISEASAETYTYRIMFMSMMNELVVTDKPRRSDEPNPWNAEIVDSTPRNTAHAAQYSLLTSAERIARARPNNCMTSLCA